MKAPIICFAFIFLATLHAQKSPWISGIWWDDCVLDDRYHSAREIELPYKNNPSQPDGWKIYELTKFAQNGDACMQKVLGELHEWNLIVTLGNTTEPIGLMPEQMTEFYFQNGTASAKWYLLAAEQGHGNAQVQLAGLYWSGRGVPQDYVEAAKWYLKAADQGIPCAQLQLGEMYRDGQGMKEDKIMAHKWMNLAAADEMGLNLHGGYCVETAVKERRALADTMTQAQIAEAQRLARIWKPHIPPDPIPQRTYDTDLGKTAQK